MTVVVCGSRTKLVGVKYRADDAGKVEITFDFVEREKS